jgi:hypothetical protein
MIDKVPSNKIVLPVFLAIVLLLLSASDGRGENLVEYGSDSLGNIFYYDRDSVKKRSGNVTVWTTTLWSDSDQRKYDMIAALKKRVDCPDCEKLSMIKDFSEVKCRENLMRKITFVFYDKDSRVLYRWTSPTPGEWEVILPGTFQDILKRKVCQ